MKNFYEFFAGGGMAHAGLGDTWSCNFANDFCEKKSTSYIANWGDKHFVPGDIKNVVSEQLPGRADLAWASFPCQDLSLAGNGVGLNGQRSGTFWAFIKLMQKLREENRKPRIIALENVYGALTSHGGKDFEAILEAVVSEGYRVGAMIIDAVHFLPQSRPRLFIIAIDNNLHVPNQLLAKKINPVWHPPSIVKAHENLSPRLKDNWLWWDLPFPEIPPQTLIDVIHGSVDTVSWHSKTETDHLLGLMSEINLKKVDNARKSGTIKVGTIYRRTRLGMQRAEVRFDGIAGCLRTPGGGSSRQTIIIVDGGEVKTRLLSAREAARLMGLDNTYILPTRYNDAYHIAGDGVAVPVVSHLAKNIFDPIIEQTRVTQLILAA